MSLESAKAYIERMKTDEEFRKKVNECKDAEARMKFVNEAGFDFTGAEVNAVTTELSDEELAGIAGGASGEEYYQAVDGHPCCHNKG